MGQVNEQAKQLGNALVAAKVLSQEHLDKAIQATESGKYHSLIIALLEAGWLSYQVFEKFLTGSLKIKSAIIADRPADQGLINQVGEDVIREKMVFPIVIKEANGKKNLALGMVDPLDEDAAKLISEKTTYRVVPILISLPDFKQTLQNHLKPLGAPKPRSSASVVTDPFSGRKSIELGEASGDEKIVLIRPGGYEEEVDMKASLSERTRTRIGVSKEQDENSMQQTKFSIQRHATNDKGASQYLGPNLKKFREEVIAKLELKGSDASVIHLETYTRETLMNDLISVSPRPLETAYKNLDINQKVEAIANALIKNNLMTKRDLFTSAAVTIVFGDKKAGDKSE